MKTQKIAVAMMMATVSMALCLGGCTAAGSGTEEPETKPRVVGYLPDWSYSFYRDLDFEALTHLNIAFCNPDSRGNLSCGIPDSELQEIVDRSHSAGVKVFAALGGGGGCNGYLPLVDTPEKMADFNEKIMLFCETHGLDGVDLDIELDSSHKIWNYYADWVASLRALCDEREYELSTATAQWVAIKVTAETFNLFDFVNVMAYDNDGDRSSHASYAFAESSLNYFLERGIEQEKLVLGVPFYGRGYDKNGKLDWNSYRSFASLIDADHANYFADTYQGVAYNGAELIARKCALAKDYGGIMIWEVTLDAKGEYSLLNVIKTEMT